MSFPRCSLVTIATGLLLICAQSAVSSNDNDLIVGSQGEDDISLFRATISIVPPELMVRDSTEYTAGGVYFNISCVEALESGLYPDANATIIAGGPNHNFVTMLFSTGPSQRLNYTLNLYGTNDNSTITKSITTSRTDYYLL